MTKTSSRFFKALLLLVTCFSVPGFLPDEAHAQTSAPPVIVSQPQSQTVFIGETATFHVEATGTPPLGYRWRRYGETMLDFGPGTDTLTITNVQMTNAGYYTVIVTNSARPFGVESSIATLTVRIPSNSPPIITRHPTPNRFATVGDSVDFDVTAIGPGPLRYQWRFNDADIPGATFSRCTLSNVRETDSGTYVAVVSNANGSATSNPSILVVTTNRPPIIWSGPQSQTVVVGENATFHVQVLGTPPFWFRWLHNGETFVDFGEGTNILTIVNVQPTHAGTYSVLVTNNANPYGFLSTNAVLTVTTNQRPVITSQPQSQTVMAGETATFHVEATGTPPLSYRWCRDGVSISGFGQGTGTLTIPNVQFSNAGIYTVVITNLAGPPGVISSNAALTVLSGSNTPPLITRQPTNRTVAVGGTVVFSVQASGPSPLSYQWYFNNLELPGKTASGFIITNVQLAHAGAYFVRVSNPFGSVDSSNAVLTIIGGTNQPPTITTHPQSQTVLAGSDVSFSVEATGTQPLSYRWRRNGATIPGRTMSVLVLTNVIEADAGTYSVVVSNSVDSRISSNAVLTVLTPLAAVPRIIDLNPLATGLGSTITIRGENFSAMPESNTVYFGAVRAPVTSAKETNLEVTVPVGATFANVTVTVGGLTAYSDSPFSLTFPSNYAIDQNSFASRITLPTGFDSGSPVFADMDGDGKPDVVFVNYQSSTLSIYRNISGGGPLTVSSFAARVDFATGQNPANLAAGDLDGDGKLDLVVVNDYGASVSIFRNASTPGVIDDASLASRVDLPGETHPISVVIRDLDRDGKPDLAVANAAHAPSTVSIYRNVSTPGSLHHGSFAPRVNFAVGSYPFSIAVGDLNSDHKPDLVVANIETGDISVLQNFSAFGSTDALSFGPKVDLPVDGGRVHYVRIVDLDQDTWPDIVCAHDGGLSIFPKIPGNDRMTPASFAPRIDLPVNGVAYEVTAGDLDGDSKPDLAFTVLNSGAVHVLHNQSSAGALNAGSFAAPVSFAGAGNSVAIGDLDGDGKPELVTCLNFVLSIYQNVLSARSPTEMLEELILAVDGADLDRKNKRPLIVTLKSSLAALDRGQPVAAANQLRAFQQKVQAQIAPSDSALAELLIAAAQEIVDALNEP